jgi:hypothetical protein
MLPVETSVSNQYYEGVNEVLGYKKVNDIVYYTFRNCVICVEENPSHSLARTIVGVSKYPKDYIFVTRAVNLITFLGYLPGMSSIVSIKNFYLAFGKVPQSPMEDPRNEKMMRRAAFVRGIFELFALGILVSPLDIFVTVKRRSNPPVLDDLYRRAKMILRNQEQKPERGILVSYLKPK